MEDFRKVKRFIEKARAILSEGSLLTSAEDCAHYATDWTKLPGKAGAVALPRTTDEVARLLMLCSQEKIRVVPSGGRTGLAGGAVAAAGELVLSLGRMNQLGTVGFNSRTLRVQAGVTTQAVHEHCAQAGLTWPIDLASKGSSQIGGNLATNAGGVRVIRYGMARKWIAGLQVVTMRGDILELNRDLEKNNTGYDLIQLLVGSEGTLAVTTEATLKLTRLPRDVQVLFFGLPSLESVQHLLENARRGPFDILSFEFFSSLCLKTVEQKLNRHSRLSTDSAFYVLMEIEQGRGDSALDSTSDWLGEVLEQGIVADGLMAGSSQEQREVWGLREGITESIALTGPVRKYDACVPAEKMVPFLTEAIAIAENGGFPFELYLFGHFGDGSPHLNLVKSDGVKLADYESGCERMEEALFPLLKKFSGSISAEHGVGLLKKNGSSTVNPPKSSGFSGQSKKPGTRMGF